MANKVPLFHFGGRVEDSHIRVGELHSDRALLHATGDWVRSSAKVGKVFPASTQAIDARSVTAIPVNFSDRRPEKILLRSKSRHVTWVGVQVGQRIVERAEPNQSQYIELEFEPPAAFIILVAMDIGGKVPPSYFEIIER